MQIVSLKFPYILKIFKRLLFAIVFCALSLGAIHFLTPLVLQVRAQILPSEPRELELFLQKQETLAQLRSEELQKQIVWHFPDKSRTKIALVYLHGFSATRKEISPVVENLALALQANVYFARYKAHGERPEDYANLHAQDFLDEVEQALQIGKKIGGQVFVIGTSTGAILAAGMAAAHREGIQGLVLISPAWAVFPRSSPLLSGVWGDFLVKLVMGPFYEWKAQYPRQDFYWNTKMDSLGLVALMQTIRWANEKSYENLQIPSLWFLNPEDKVIVPEEARLRFEKFGGKKQLMEIQSRDHVLAGDITSPQTTEEVTQIILRWIKAN